MNRLWLNSFLADDTRFPTWFYIRRVIKVILTVFCICYLSVTGGSSTAGESQIEPGEYENLPFHGMQTPPKKVRIITESFHTHIHWANADFKLTASFECALVNVFAVVFQAMLAKNSLAPAVKCPNKSLTPSCFPTHPYNYINYQQRDSNSKPTSSLSSYNTSQSTVLTNQSNMSSLSNSQDSSSNTNNSYLSKTIERKKPHQHQQLLDNSDTLSTHSFSSGKSLKRPPGPGGTCGENKKLIDLETVTPLYENLTDSIQIHESPMGNAGNGIGAKFAIDGQERYKISLRKPRKSSSRSNSAVSNSYYDCIKPIPAPRHRKYASTTSLFSKNIQMYSNKLDPIYMNLPVSSGYETDPRSNDEFNSSEVSTLWLTALHWACPNIAFNPSL